MRGRALKKRYGHAGVAGKKIIASSYERYNGGAAVKRLHGSSTVTRFYVFYKEDEKDPSKWEKIEAKGPTPGERKTSAIEQFKRLREGGGHSPAAPIKIW